MAGIINAVALLGFEHQAVSHMSGIATRFGVELFSFSHHSLHLLVLLISFLGGAIISGILIESTEDKPRGHYSIALTLEGVLLILSMWALKYNLSVGHFLAAIACGLQNAMITSYSGAIIRTTHVTGVFTDLGLLLGAIIKGHPFQKRKFTLYLLIISGFILGGTAGAIAFKHWSYMTLTGPATMAILFAVSYRIIPEKKHTANHNR